jgi:mevalonate kinase
MNSASASAPAKAILIGEHAVNRGAAALAVSVGLRARCTVRPADAPGYRFTGGGHAHETSRDALLALGRAIDRARAEADYGAIQQLAARDFFAPAKYALAGLGAALPAALDVRFESEIPQAAGLGSGGATVVALVAAAARLLGEHGDARRLADLARRGDIVAHGGVASGLDSQTSLFGGAIRYTAEREGEPIRCGEGLRLVIGHSGVFAATSAVNGRVREWLAARPARLHYFHEIGLLASHAEAALREGDWPSLGQLMNLNQLILERIGVSCPELEALNEAALAAGAYGAKLSGSGGGGIMVALVSEETAAPVARAIEAAGGEPIVAPVGVGGVEVIRREA